MENKEIRIFRYEVHVLGGWDVPQMISRFLSSSSWD